LDGFLQELAVLAAVRVDNQLSCGITCRDESPPGHRRRLDDFAAAFDEQQYEAGRGPCLTAMSTGQRVEIPNLADVLDQWGAYGTRALAHGLGAVLSIPLIAVDTTWEY
jgi:hypothetical protein